MKVKGLYVFVDLISKPDNSLHHSQVRDEYEADRKRR